VEDVEAVAQHIWGTAPQFVGPRHELRERLLLKIFLSGRPGKRVLNAGAGLGSYSLMLEQHGFEVTSTDVSEDALLLLRRRVSGSVVRADLKALPFGDASYDAVVLGEVLEHVEDDVGALRETARVLRAGGLAAISVPANPNWFGPSDVWAGHWRRYRRDELASACGEAGLSLERCVAWGFPASALYHRFYYDRRAASLSEQSGPASLRRRAALGLLRALLQVDRVFVGVERGALGYLALARRTP
jgi:SAM-dependent methyltransferase